MTYWKSDDFKALQDEWYRKLEESGFSDSEKNVFGHELLKQRSAHPYRNTPDVVKAAKENYFRLISQYIHDEVFYREVDRLVLTMYANGHLIRVICAELERMGVPRARNSVRFIIRRFEMKWGIRIWTRRQLNHKG